jgi:hypothetical protein
MGSETSSVRTEVTAAPSSASEASGERASLNQVLWRELQALRPEYKPKDGPAGFTATDEDRAKNLRALFRQIGQFGNPSTEFKNQAPLAALCFSGGGIRSATFNLGVLQALARAKLLHHFDYLSSVSGGGYIASWLRRWMFCGGGYEEVEKQLRGRDDNGAPIAADPLRPEPRALDHLREYSNYLTPKLGLFSADTWTIAATIVRNLLLNWLVIIPLVAALVALPQLAYLGAYGTHTAEYGLGLLWAATGVELAAAVCVHGCRRFGGGKHGSRIVVALGVWPVIIAAAALAVAALCLGEPWKASGADLERWRSNAFKFAWIWCLGIPFLGWVAVEIGQLIFLRRRGAAGPERSTFWRTFAWELIGLGASGAGAAYLLYLVSLHWLPYLAEHPALFSILATPCLLGLYLLARVWFVAFASQSDSAKRKDPEPAVAGDADREWWARLSGWILGLTLTWIAGASMCIFGQWLLVQGTNWVVAAVAAGGGISGAFAALAGSGDHTASSNHKPSLGQKLALRLAVPIAAVCVIALISWGTAILGGWLVGDAKVFVIQNDLGRAGIPGPFTDYAIFACVPIAAILAALLFGFFVNVNRFSLHGMYRNRLVRAYLGASNEKREPDRFTGFDPKDNVRMYQLRGAEPHKTPMRLLPVINVTLNLLRDVKLAWQQRKAESFSITPYYCGNFYEGYRDSKLYGGPGGITLGTAMTISGAAANPNMGYCSSPVLAFLMALFNVRLGAWLGNPNATGESTFSLPGPQQALVPLIGELFGFTTRDFKYVNLSDGGHFDNLGVYEMVLRRCRHIVVCDAGCDGKGTLDDLGRAIRAVRIDFGISIVFDKVDIIPTGKADKGLYCATATIQYPDIDGNEVTLGRLLYLKPTRAGRGGEVLPYDIYAYAKESTAFPHESTIDQWFSESQFESYRMLGEHTVRQILQGATPGSVGALIERADAYLKANAVLPASTVAAVKAAA